jgi:MoaA/NifB/PqqE/SkfB family radical SAM enzyme
MKFRTRNLFIDIIDKLVLFWGDKIGYEPIIYENDGRIFLIQKTTNQCNNRCSFCVTPYCFSKLGRLVKPPTTKEFKDIISKYKKHVYWALRKKRKPDFIAFTTTEPTLRKDIVEILDYSLNIFPNAKVSLLTNARKFSDKRYLRTFENVISKVNFQIPLHSMDEKLHDELTRIKGSYNETIG